VDLRPFGKTDLRVSPLCLGTMQFGWTADEAASFAVLDAFVEAGGNFLDSADVYSNWVPDHTGGESEQIIGRWMQARGNRGRLVVATKARGKMWDGPDGEGLRRSHIERAAEDSLRRLQVDTIDLYQCHWPDLDTPVEETLRAFDDLVRAGKVRYIGLSNYVAAQLGEALRVADERSLPRAVALQPHYNLVHRSEYEGALDAVCAREGVAVIPYSPLAAGFLTGKYRSGQPTPRSQRAGRVKQYMTEQGMAVLSALDGAAAAHGTTVAAVALAWLLAKPAVAAPIIGANSVEQLSALLPAAELRLSDAGMQSLDAASAGL
jgi:aryl-alcohol dehydrogenase-like predicted oxidoreductase